MAVNALVKSQVKLQFNHRRQIGDLLCQLGLKYRTHNFWLDHQGRLDEVFQDAYQRYRHLAFRVQPRTLTDDRETATQLNSVWSEVKRRFYQHMHPQLILSGGLPARNYKRPPHGKYLRFCKYRKCGIQFFSPWKNQKFCCRNHGLYENALHRRAVERSYRPILYRQCAYKPCGVRFVASRKRQIYHAHRCQVYAGSTRWNKKRKWNPVTRHWELRAKCN